MGGDQGRPWGSLRCAKGIRDREGLAPSIEFIAGKSAVATRLYIVQSPCCSCFNCACSTFIAISVFKAGKGLRQADVMEAICTFIAVAVSSLRYDA